MCFNIENRGIVVNKCQQAYTLQNTMFDTIDTENALNIL